MSQATTAAAAGAGIARTVGHMLDVLGYDRVDAPGVSLGGIAQQFAHPALHRVQRLILAATGPGLGRVPGSLRARWRLPGHAAIPARLLLAHRQGVYGGSAREDPDALLHGSPARFIERPTVCGYLGQIYAITGWTSIPGLRTLPRPALVLAGDDNPIVPLVNARILARLIPDARLHILRRASHLFVLERPAEAAGLIAAFLAEGPSPPGNPPEWACSAPKRSLAGTLNREGSAISAS